jgi:hypothetical protein
MFMPIGKPMSVGLGALDIDAIERAVRPSEAQRAALDELRAISAKAEDAVRKACPGKPSRDSTGASRHGGTAARRDAGRYPDASARFSVLVRNAER